MACFSCPSCYFYQTVHEGRIHQLKLFCGKDYPDNPPSVRFQTRINMTCVNQETGAVRDNSCIGFITVVFGIELINY